MAALPFTRSDPSENGEFSIVKIKDEMFKPECQLCEKKSECDEYLFYCCNCWGCRTDDYVCKNCALTTSLFTHLCVCFRQNTAHFWYNLKKVLGGERFVKNCF